MNAPVSPDARLTASPCVRMCTLDEADVCLGCGRTLTDITGWTKMSEPEKAACVEHGRQRLAAMGRPVVTGPSLKRSPSFPGNPRR